MPRIIKPIPTNASPHLGVQQFAQQARQNLSEAFDAIIESRVRQTIQANRSRSDAPAYQVDDLVYLSTKNLLLPKGRVRKLIPKYIGPMKITEIYADNGNFVKLDLPQGMRQHNRFNVAVLRPHFESDAILFPKREASQLYDYGLPDEKEWFVQSISNHKWLDGNLHFLVNWTVGDTTWEPLDACQDLEALDGYLQLSAVETPEQLPKIDHSETSRARPRGRPRGSNRSRKTVTKA